MKKCTFTSTSLFFTLFTNKHTERSFFTKYENVDKLIDNLTYVIKQIFH